MADKSLEFEPPVACVNRILKNVLPDNILLTKEARAAFVRATGIFIFYLTHASNEFTRENKRQTIFPQDVVNALKEIGFEDFERPLMEFLDAYRREAASAKKSKKTSTKEQEANGEDAIHGEEEEEDYAADHGEAVVDEHAENMED